MIKVTVRHVKMSMSVYMIVQGLVMHVQRMLIALIHQVTLLFFVRSHTMKNLGSFICECHIGYTTMDGRNCYDIDECDINSWETAHGCHPDAQCINTVGSYECSCLEGFLGNGMATGGTGVTVTMDGMNNQDGCRDIDECNTLKPCGIYTLCTNSQGSTNKSVMIVRFFL